MFTEIGLVQRLNSFVEPLPPKLQCSRVVGSLMDVGIFIRLHSSLGRAVLNFVQSRNIATGKGVLVDKWTCRLSARSDDGVNERTAIKI